MEPGPEPVPALDATQLGLTGQNAIWPADHWWQRYGDSQLDALVDEALANSPSMSSAQARLAQANAAVSTARSSLLPKVDANYTLNREHLSKQYIYPAPLGGSVVSDNRLALDFSYELDLWGKNRSRLKSAVSQQAAAAADAQARATCSPALSCAPTSICRTASPSAACSSACWRSAPTCSN